MSQNQLDAKMFKEMFLAGAKNLESKKDRHFGHDADHYAEPADRRS